MKLTVSCVRPGIVTPTARRALPEKSPRSTALDRPYTLSKPLDASAALIDHRMPACGEGRHLRQSLPARPGDPITSVVQVVHVENGAMGEMLRWCLCWLCRLCTRWMVLWCLLFVLSMADFFSCQMLVFLRPASRSSSPRFSLRNDLTSLRNASSAAEN